MQSNCNISLCNRNNIEITSFSFIIPDTNYYISANLRTGDSCLIKEKKIQWMIVYQNKCITYRSILPLLSFINIMSKKNKLFCRIIEFVQYLGTFPIKS